MIPKSEIGNVPLAQEQQPSKTFQLREDRLTGMADGLEAVKQAVYFALNVERYDWPIYSWNYGVELRDLLGQPRDYVQSELKRRIPEALLQDDRIEAVDGFRFEFHGRAVTAWFTVHSMYGDFEKEAEALV